MAQQTTVSIAFKGIELEDKASEEKLREVIDRRCEQLSNEFHEVSRIEISFEQDGLRYVGHAHVTGKQRDIGAQAEASEPLPAADRLLEKLER
jgi:ribosome-associated translation inhibitor RaiA